MINSPGGYVEATEAIVMILRHKFKSIRFVVPNTAKSASTLLVLSGDLILMDQRSELGPIDPQIEYPTGDGRKRDAVEDILEGFEEAKQILKGQGSVYIPAYAPLLNKYTVGFLRGCDNARKLSKKLAEEWLRAYMFSGDPNSPHPQVIAEYFGVRANTLSHNRGIFIDKCLDLQMKVEDLRKPQNKKLSDLFWELWCLYEVYFDLLPVSKCYENTSGCNLIKLIRQNPNPPVTKPPALPTPPPVQVIPVQPPKTP